MLSISQNVHEEFGEKLKLESLTERDEWPCFLGSVLSKEPHIYFNLLDLSASVVCDLLDKFLDNENG